MKLRQIKLAGFKTFVDPTTISLPGQLVGIVGPNGCGKSNIIESVKWVLGSSSAKELRGESMESVIFSGTDTRPAISRASVELLFDNSENKAANEWAKYTEIAVRRVIEKDKGSTYSINGINVRRKDVADLFYGTGLGTRGYAIIGQNTISQLVEAKPEDLKSFLEEAAGISKYKERRKETEFRLRDTRDNLQRIRDLEKEINSAITKLEAQAEAAKKYNSFKEELKLLQAKLAYLKKESAGHEWQESQKLLKQIEIQVEQKKAELTKAEINVEKAREDFRTESESINPIQANFYEVSSKVSATESKIESNHNEEERVKNQINQSDQRIKQISEESIRLGESIVSLENDLKDCELSLSNYSSLFSSKQEEYKKSENKYKAIASQFSEKSNQLQTDKEQLRLDQNTLSFIETKLKDFDNRLNALSNDRQIQQTTIKDAEDYGKDDLDLLHKKIEDLSLAIADQKTIIEDYEISEDDLNEHKQSLQAQLSDISAEIKSSTNLMEAHSNQNQISNWLQQNNIDANTSLLNTLDIDDKWTNALDAVIGLKSNAYFSENSAFKKPSQAITLLKTSKHAFLKTSLGDLNPLTHFIKIDNPYQGAVDDLLHDVFVIEDMSQLQRYRDQLNLGQSLVDVDGNIYGKHYQYINGDNQIKFDTFATKAKIEDLIANQNSLNKDSEGLQSQINSLRTSIENSKEYLSDLLDQRELSEKQAKEIEIKFAKQRHQLDTANERLKQIDRDIETINQEKQLIENDRQLKINKITSLEASNATDEQSLLKLENTKLELEKIFSEAKRVFDEAEKQKREIEYQFALLNNKIADTQARKELLTNEYNSLSQSTNDYSLERFTELNDSLNNKLKTLIIEKDNAEKLLKAKRDQLAIIENNLRELEQIRLSLVQEIAPLSDKQQNQKLNEQQKRIDFDYAMKEYTQYQIDEEEVAKNINEETLTSLNEKIEKLNQKIERIGPINMAAVAELDIERERVKYINMQVDDLTEASATLESAIGKIDRETREKLKATFNEVNQNLNDYFRKLFGGGRAVLELLGNEILDTGLQIVAQPPGKKNTTIHLLSGGEKALTAIALVFALFRLNPAPFCLLDEVDAPLDDSNTERFCDLVKEMSSNTQFLYVTHNKITMELAEQLIGVTMQESGVSRIVEVDLNDVRMDQESKVGQPS